MTREEFITQLRLTLQGKVSSGKVQENISYYNEYINGEIQKGKSEAEVLHLLGDPALLAKTIIAADDAGKHQQSTIYDVDEDGRTSKKEEYDHTSEFGYSGGGKIHMFRMDKWWHKLLLVLMVIMVVLFIVAVVTGLIRIIAPFVLPIVVIVLVVRIFSRRR